MGRHAKTAEHSGRCSIDRVVVCCIFGFGIFLATVNAMVVQSDKRWLLPLSPQIIKGMAGMCGHLCMAVCEN